MPCRPEQIAGRREVTPAADVWALGVLLYWTLTGIQPFDGGNLAELMARIHSANAPPPSSLEPEVSPALDRVFARACAAEPGDRYPDGHAFAEAIEQALAAPEGGLRPRALAAGLAVAAVLCAGGLLFSQLRGGEVAEVPEAPAEASAPAPATTHRPPLLQVTDSSQVGAAQVHLKVVVRSAAPWVDVTCQGETQRVVPGELGGELLLTVAAEPGLNAFIVEAVDPAGQAAHPARVQVELEVWPDWYSKLPPPLRPTFPLPEGVRFGAEAGEYVNTKDRSRLVWIPMGELNEGPTVNHAAFPEGFFMGRCEVSWTQYRAFCRDTGRPRPENVVRKGARTYRAGDDQGVFNVSQHDAQAYCAWAGLRLPRNAEWEYAAAVSYNEAGRLRLCVDMDGANREWVADAIFDPARRGQRYLVRGGSHKHILTDASLSSTKVPGFVADDIGFRVARSAN